MNKIFHGRFLNFQPIFPEGTGVCQLKLWDGKKISKDNHSVYLVWVVDKYFSFDKQKIPQKGLCFKKASDLPGGQGELKSALFFMSSFYKYQILIRPQ